MPWHERRRTIAGAALAALVFATPCFAKPTSLIDLSGVRPIELIQRFNADAAQTRFLVVLSPT